MNHVFHTPTLLVLCCVAFLAGLIAMGIAKDERWNRLRLKLVVVTTERDRFREALGSLNRQYYDLEHVLEMRGDEVHTLRAEVIRLRRGPKAVPRGDGPPEAA